MKINRTEKSQILNESGKKVEFDLKSDFKIEIFCESMKEYFHKINEAAKGRYELDDYDKQVISLAMDQYA